MAIKRKLLAFILIRPPSRPSNGAQTINEQLGGLSRLSRKSPVPDQFKLIINWGNSSSLTTRKDARVLNGPQAIGNAANKLTAFHMLRDKQVRVPDFATKPPSGSKDIWLARTVLSGSGGDGIVVVRPGDTFPKAQLYTKYVPKLIEYRIHVANGVAIFAQMKKRKLENEQDKDEKLIRNYDNGWVFCPIELPLVRAEHLAEAVKAVKALGLDFGAVDMVIGKKDNNAYVLEINTAPGLESPGLIAAYKDAFRKYAGV